MFGSTVTGLAFVDSDLVCDHSNFLLTLFTLFQDLNFYVDGIDITSSNGQCCSTGNR